MKSNNHKNTVAGTDVEEVKQQSKKSGLSYNEAIDFIAKTTGGRDTHIYSDTDVEAIKKENEQ